MRRDAQHCRSITRVSAIDSARPITVPTSASLKACPTVSRMTSAAEAPSAMRRPISWRRWVTR